MISIKFFINIIGSILVIISSIYIISYLNLIDIGYNFKEYVYFIIRRIECHILWIGIVLLFFVLHRKGE